MSLFIIQYAMQFNTSSSQALFSIVSPIFVVNSNNYGNHIQIELQLTMPSLNANFPISCFPHHTTHVSRHFSLTFEVNEFECGATIVLSLDSASLVSVHEFDLHI